MSVEGVTPPDPVVEPEAEHLGSEEQLAAEPEQWERFEEDPELREIEEHDELDPYEPAHAAGGDPLMDDEPFTEHEVEPPPRPADLAGRAEAEPRNVAEASPAPVAPHLEQETEEYELQDDPEADDDVLKTTPEFLQDAPDHDRLWFEQRPPRDFDFDG